MTRAPRPIEHENQIGWCWACRKVVYKGTKWDLEEGEGGSKLICEKCMVNPFRERKR